MREEKIRVVIKPDGSSTVEVSGVKGKRCLEMTEDLEEELGSVTERKEKKEMREKPAVISAKNEQDIHRR